MSDTKDWQAWHGKYATSADLAERLQIVQEAIRDSLAQSHRRPYKIIDIGAGDGRDLIGALKDIDHKESVEGLLIEIDKSLADKAKADALDAGLTKLNIVLGDAALLQQYESFAPADLILLCGIFGNISDEDIGKTISALPMLSKPGTRIIWTRNRRIPDKVPAIRGLFSRSGFTEVSFVAPEQTIYAVGVNEYTDATVPLDKNINLFTFIR